ncbi:MAG: DUF1109 domain-containing protein [Hyphomicrobiaceae bacterium]|nr:DUF1109 domain-containing protein [Hyphomicrobiaceae bacterium]
MKLDDLVRTLAEDTQQPRLPLGRQLTVGLATGAALSCAILLVTAGVRPDLPEALLSWQVLAKFAFAGLLMAAAFAASLDAAQPDARGGSRALAAAPGLLAAAVGAELLTTPAGTWGAAASGRHPELCLVVVPALSALPLIAAVATLRRAAPASPTRLGLAMGLLCGALGAFVYMLRCTDDAPLFVAIWYSAAIALVGLAGALAGRRAFRW